MTKRYIIVASILVASVAGLMAPTDGLAQRQQVARSVEGSWRGDFGAGQWTFTFSRASGKWSGSYTFPQYKGVEPLTNLAASDGAAKFSINAKTSVDFDLKLDRSRDAMVGTVRFGKGVKPGSAPVTVPVQLTRMS